MCVESCDLMLNTLSSLEKSIVNDVESQGILCSQVGRQASEEASVCCLPWARHCSEVLS